MSIHRFLSFTIISAMALSLVACQTPVDREPIAVTPVEFGDNESSSIARVYIVTDASSSMFRSGSSNAKALTQSVIANLPDEQDHPYKVSWIAYGSTERVRSPLAPLDRSALSQQVAATGPVGGILSQGGTTYTHRIFEELAVELEGTTEQTAIVLITDGDTHDPLRALHRANDLVNQQNGSVCIHVVQVGKDRLGTAVNKAIGAISPCGTNRLASSITTASDVAVLSRDVFGLDSTQMPDVAAPAAGEPKP